MIRRVSKARAKQQRQYAKLKAHFLANETHCFACKHWVFFEDRELHHWAGRVGRLLYYEPAFRMACPKCHAFIHAHPATAFIRGLIAPRGIWNDFNHTKTHHEETKRYE